jgi:hypothetical protein
VLTLGLEYRNVPRQSKKALNIKIDMKGIPLRRPRTHQNMKNCAQSVPKNIENYRKLSKSIQISRSLILARFSQILDKLLTSS